MGYMIVRTEMLSDKNIKVDFDMDMNAAEVMLSCANILVNAEMKLPENLRDEFSGDFLKLLNKTRREVK